MAGKATDVVDQMFHCIQTRDISGLAALYHDDIAIWHNFTNRAQSKAENLQALGALIKAVAEIRYEVLERHELGNRVIQRHNLHCTTPGGGKFAIPASIYFTIEDGKIRRIEEYLDTAQVNPLRDATGRPRL